MIGSEYQASVPSGLSPYENSQTMPYENEDKLLWTPFIVADGPTEEYLQKCTQLQQQLMQSRIAATTASQPLQALALLASLPLGAHTRDDEQVSLIPSFISFSVYLSLAPFVYFLIGNFVEFGNILCSTSIH